MHYPLTRSTFVLLGLGVLAPLAGAATPAADASVPPSSIADALTKGKFTVNARLRWEHADQANLRESDAFTLRTRFGFTSAPLAGLQGRPPHSPTPVPVLTVSGSAGAKAISLQ